MGTAEAGIRNLAKRKSKGGRPKGSKNKFTSLKDSFLRAYQHKDGFGGDEALLEYAKKNKESFLSMIKTMLPKNLDIKTENELTITIRSAIPEPMPKKVEVGEKHLIEAESVTKDKPLLLE